MLVALFSPLAPAAVLLLGAFVLPFVVTWFAPRQRSSAGFRYLVGAGVVELAILALFGARLALGEVAPDQGLEVLSGWRFSTPETAAVLAVRVDELGLPFLIFTLMLLLAAFLVAPSLISPDESPQEGDVVSWLALGAMASFLFVAGNGITQSYAILAFDLAAAFYWFKRHRNNLAVARLALGVVTALELALATLILASGMLPGGVLMGLMLWLRLGVYPFIEAGVYARQPDSNFSVYLALSLLVTIYLFVRIPFEPWPLLVRWLVVLLILLNGGLAWLAGSFSVTAKSVEESNLAGGENVKKSLSKLSADHRPSLLIPFVLAEALIILLAVPVAQGVAVAFAAGLVLSGFTLWIAPSLGPPRLTEPAWLWPYLPALAASLTLIGLPFTLGWLTWTSFFRSLLLSVGVGTTVIVVLANALALNSLLRYWLITLRDNQKDGRRSAVSVLVMVPFLIPGLGPFILATLTRRELAVAEFDQSTGVLLAMAGSVAGAVLLEYYRGKIVERLKIPPVALADLVRLRWLGTRLIELGDRLGRAILRVQVVVEGQHYLGWAFFVALISALVILLS
jgi:hypothetical protein